MKVSQAFHKPIWIRKHGVLAESQAEEIKQTGTNVPFSLEDHKTYDQSDVMEVDEVFSSDLYEAVVENEQIGMDASFNLEDLTHS